MDDMQRLRWALNLPLGKEGPCEEQHLFPFSALLIDERNGVALVLQTDGTVMEIPLEGLDKSSLPDF